MERFDENGALWHSAASSAGGSRGAISQAFGARGLRMCHCAEPHLRQRNVAGQAAPTAWRGAGSVATTEDVQPVTGDLGKPDPAPTPPPAPTFTQSEVTKLDAGALANELQSEGLIEGLNEDPCNESLWARAEAQIFKNLDYLNLLYTYYGQLGAMRKIHGTILDEDFRNAMVSLAEAQAALVGVLYRAKRFKCRLDDLLEHSMRSAGGEILVAAVDGTSWCTYADSVGKPVFVVPADDNGNPINPSRPADGPQIAERTPTAAARDRDRSRYPARSYLDPCPADRVSQP
jgi:hypothetical protein